MVFNIPLNTTFEKSKELLYAHHLILQKKLDLSILKMQKEASLKEAKRSTFVAKCGSALAIGRTEKNVVRSKYDDISSEGEEDF